MIIRKGNQKDLDTAVSRLASLNVEKMPRDMKCVLEEIKKKRSLDQNALFHVWCTEVGDHTGNFKDYMYKWFEEKFCPPIEVCINGESEFVKCAKKLNTKKFSEFMEKVYLWCELELDFKLEWPDDPRIETQRNH